jgi:hypothetical protein
MAPLLALLSSCRALPDTEHATTLGNPAAGDGATESEPARASEQDTAAADAAASGGAAARPNHDRKAAPPSTDTAPQGTTELAIEGFLPSLLSWPRTPHWPQPVMLVAHGARERAEPHCEFWRRLLGDRGILVCLRGRPLGEGGAEDGFFFPSHLSLEREALAALDTLADLFPEQADTTAAVYAGFSQGAQMGLLMAVAHGDRLPRLLLIEGGAGDFSQARVRRFQRSGGQRVALVCGRPSCHRNAERSVARLAAAGIPSTSYYAPGAGHTYRGAVGNQLGEVFATLTRDDPRWAAS